MTTTAASVQSRRGRDETFNAGWVDRMACAPGQSKTLKEGQDPGGRPIRLSLSCDTYQGARPYFTVGRVNKGGDRDNPTRYTPFEALAGLYFEAFIAGVTSAPDVKRFVDARRAGRPVEAKPAPKAAPKPASAARLAALVKARAARAAPAKPVAASSEGNG